MRRLHLRGRENILKRLVVHSGAANLGLLMRTLPTPTVGKAPSFVGLYQFNVVVPNIGANDATLLSINPGGYSGLQTIYIAVGSN